MKTKNKYSDCFEIDDVVLMDKERMPRNKKVIIKGKRVYFYEIKGKVKKYLSYLRKKLPRTIHKHLQPKMVFDFKDQGK